MQFPWVSQHGSGGSVKNEDFPGGPVAKNPPCNAGDTGSIPGRELESHMCEKPAHPRERSQCCS